MNVGKTSLNSCLTWMQKNPNHMQSKVSRSNNKFTMFDLDYLLAWNIYPLPTEQNSSIVLQLILRLEFRVSHQATHEILQTYFLKMNQTAAEDRNIILSFSRFSAVEYLANLWRKIPAKDVSIFNVTSCLPIKDWKIPKRLLQIIEVWSYFK